MKRFSSFCFGVGILLLLLFSPRRAEAYTTNMNASVVIGQANFTSSSANQGGGASAHTVSGMRGVAVCNGKLILADRGNNRVLIYNSVPTTANAAADVVIGQANFTGTSQNQGGSVAANTLSQPHSVACVGEKLIIGDSSNNRILIFNTVPTGNNASANVVVGQADFTSNASNRGGSCAANTLANFTTLTASTDGQRLIIADSANHRVLLFNSIPTSNNASADIVIGQADFTSCLADRGSTVAANTIQQAAIAISDRTKLYVSDSANNRVLIYNSIPTTNGVAADVVIGQQNFTSESSNQGGSVAANTVNFPSGLLLHNGRLLISDQNNRRILVFNTVPTTNNAFADVAIGQANFTSNSANQGGSVGANTLTDVRYPDVFGEKLIIADGGNNRVLIYENIVNTPVLSIKEPSGSVDGKLTVDGTITVFDGNYGIWKVEASVNGGNYSSVANITPGVHYVGRSDPVAGTFSHEFSPWSFDNGSEVAWKETQDVMIREQGYTIKFRGYNTNADSAEHLFFFQPFLLHLPSSSVSSFTPVLNTGNSSPILSTVPTFTFSVNAFQRQELRAHLSHYEVWMKKKDDTSLWEKYLTNIPVDFDAVRDTDKNLRKEKALLDRGSGNGTYEDAYLLATYSHRSAHIRVRKKGIQPHTMTALTPGIYEVRISAIDKHYHTQDTYPVTVIVRGSPNNTKKLPVTTEWFPLQIDALSGIPSGILSNFAPETIESEYTAATYMPVVKGIAFSGATIRLTVTDQKTGEARFYETTAADSAFTITPTLYDTSLLDISAEDVTGRYTEIPTIAITVSGIPDLNG